jgi:hypothetical protein
VSSRFPGPFPPAEISKPIRICRRNDAASRPAFAKLIPSSPRLSTARPTVSASPTPTEIAFSIAIDQMLPLKAASPNASERLFVSPAAALVASLDASSLSRWTWSSRRCFLIGSVAFASAPLRPSRSRSRRALSTLWISPSTPARAFSIFREAADIASSSLKSHSSFSLIRHFQPGCSG